MTAFLQATAPAHRLLLARRIARNLHTLSRQPEVFGPDDRACFLRLAERWQQRAAMLAPQPATHAGWRPWLRLWRLLPGATR